MFIQKVLSLKRSIKAFTAPLNTVPPVVSGTPLSGNDLTSTTGTFVGTASITYSYQWVSGGVNVGTNSNTYTLTDTDAGNDIICVVTASNSIGNTNANSNTLHCKAFVSTWTTTGASQTVTIPYVAAGVYTGTIYWGDGSSSVNSFANKAHVYAVAGTYTIKITGTVSGFTFNNAGSKTVIKSIIEWGTFKPVTAVIGSSAMFHGCSNLTASTVIDVPDLSSCTTLISCFRNCLLLATVNHFNEWNVSTITDMSLMFSGASVFNQDIHSWDVSHATTMATMFSSATLFNGNITTWTPSSATSMSSMFTNATHFNQAIGGWNISSLTNMSNMFSGASIFNQPLNSWNTSNVTNMSTAFRSCPMFNQDLNSWDTSKVTNMSSMFQSCTVFNGNISSWNTALVQSTSNMFLNNTAFNINIGNWNMSTVADISNMFSGATIFNQNLGSWNIANVLSAITFMAGVTMSSSNLNAIYNGWSLLSVQPNITISFGNSTYTSAGSAGKAILVNAPHNWIITDGGLV